MVGKKAPFSASSSDFTRRTQYFRASQPAPGEPFLGGLSFTRPRSTLPSARSPPRTSADHAAAPACPRRGPGGADRDRPRRQGLPRRPGAERALQLLGRRRTDRQRDLGNQQKLLRQTRKPGRTDGDRIRERGERRPQRGGPPAAAGRSARRAGRDVERAEVARTRLRAARRGDGHDRDQDADRARRSGVPEGDRLDRQTDAEAARRRRDLRNRDAARNQRQAGRRRDRRRRRAEEHLPAGRDQMARRRRSRKSDRRRQRGDHRGRRPGASTGSAWWRRGSAKTN